MDSIRAPKGSPTRSALRCHWCRSGMNLRSRYQSRGEPESRGIMPRNRASVIMKSSCCRRRYSRAASRNRTPETLNSPPIVVRRQPNGSRFDITLGSQMFPTSRFSLRFWLTAQRHLRAKTGHTAGMAATSGYRNIASSLARIGSMPLFQSETLTVSLDQ